MNTSHFKWILVVFFGALFWKPGISYAQSTLNAGDIYSFQFSSLPFIQSISGPFASHSQFTVAQLDRLSSSLNPAFRLEMFDTTVNQAPFATAESDLSQSPLGPRIFSLPLGWADRSGAVRFTLLSGSLRATNVQMQVAFHVGPNFPTYALYGMDIRIAEENILRVPEPGSYALLIFGSVLLAFFYRPHRL